MYFVSALNVDKNKDQLTGKNLPEKISNNLCSLVPNEIRNVLVCEINFDFDGELKSYNFLEARIKSHQRTTYNEVEKYLKNNSPSMSRNVKESIGNLRDLTKKLLLLRNKRQALEINGQEPILKINDAGKVESIGLPSQLFAHQMIEEASVKENGQVGYEEFLRLVKSLPEFSNVINCNEKDKWNNYLPVF